MGVVNSATFHHTAFIVNDLEKSAYALADSMGLQWKLWTIKPVATMVRGQEVPFSFRVAIAQVGDSYYELITPHTGDSVYVEHLKSNGEGFHHTCITFASFAALYKARDAMLRQGRKILQSASLGDAGEFYYFDMVEMGAVLELLFIRELPPPEKIIGYASGGAIPPRVYCE